MLTQYPRHQAGSLELVTPAGSDPVTVDEMKAHARLDVVSEGDDFMAGLIAAATDEARRITGRALITETWRLVLDAWPGARDDWWSGVREGTLAMLQGGSVEIRKAPFVAVTSVETIAEDGTATAFASSNWYAAKVADFGRLALRQGCTWPDMSAPVRAVGGIRITFTAGYGADPQMVPVPIRQAIKMLAAHYYENREALGEGQQIPLGASALLAKFRVLR